MDLTMEEKDSLSYMSEMADKHVDRLLRKLARIPGIFQEDIIEMEKVQEECRGRLEPGKKVLKRLGVKLGDLNE